MRWELGDLSGWLYMRLARCPSCRRRGRVENIAMGIDCATLACGHCAHEWEVA